MAGSFDVPESDVVRYPLRIILLKSKSTLQPSQNLLESGAFGISLDEFLKNSHITCMCVWSTFCRVTQDANSRIHYRFVAGGKKAMEILSKILVESGVTDGAQPRNIDRPGVFRSHYNDQ